MSPLEVLDLDQCGDLDELLRAMSRTALGARQLGEAADVLYEMVTDPECFIVGSFSGVMTVAKMGLVIVEMIEHGMLDTIISTGALMGHGFIESAGMKHFKHDSSMDDTALYEAGYDRIYDTLELEANFDTSRKIAFEILNRWDVSEPLCSHKYMRELGKYLKEKATGRSILTAAYERDVPVYVPAFTDSEVGMTVALFNAIRRKRGQPTIRFEPFDDFDAYVESMRPQTTVGLFTIGGGVPRNWAQQVGPFLQTYNEFFEEDRPALRYKYAIRICPEPAYWGGASGAPYTESVTWGKILPKSQGGRWAEVLSDATIAWPLIIKAVLQRLDKEQRKAKG